MNLERQKQFIIRFLYIFILTGLVFALFKYGIPLVFPFLFALFVAYILKKPIAFLTGKLHVKRTVASIFLVVFFYAIIGSLVSFLTVKLFVELKELVLKLPEVYSAQISPLLTRFLDDLETYITRIDPSLIDSLDSFSSDLLTSVSSMISGASVRIVSMISGWASSLPTLLISLLVAIIATFFITVDYTNIRNFLLAQLPPRQKQLILEIKNHLFHTLAAYGKSYALILSITFVELSIGLSIIGVKNSIYLALVIALLDILPVLGTGTVMIPWTLICFFNGRVGLAVKLLIVYVIITIVRNIIEPKIVGNQVGLHPAATLLAMFVGTKLFGAIGLFGLPITLSLLKNLNDTKVIHIFKEY